MSATPQTIQIFLPAGAPQGIRIAEINTRIVLRDFLMPDRDPVAAEEATP